MNQSISTVRDWSKHIGKIIRVKRWHIGRPGEPMVYGGGWYAELAGISSDGETAYLRQSGHVIEMPIGEIEFP